MGWQVALDAGAFDAVAELPSAARQDPVAIVDHFEGSAVVEADADQAPGADETFQPGLPAGVGVVVRRQQDVDEAEPANGDVRPRVVTAR